MCVLWLAAKSQSASECVTILGDLDLFDLTCHIKKQNKNNQTQTCY